MNELEIVQILNNFGAGTFLDRLTVLISNNFFITIIFLSIFTIICTFDKKNFKKLIIGVVVALALHLLISELLFKYLLPYFGIFRLRPYLAYPDLITPLGTNWLGSSFPSGHMSTILSILTPIVFYYRKFWLPTVIFALFMAFARIHNGMHYPTDVLGGAVLGSLYGLLAIYLSKKYFLKKPKS